MTISFHDLSKMTRTARDQLLKRAEADLSEFEEKVKPIVFAVKHEGDEAVARFARQFDKAPVEADALAATEDDFARAEASLDPQVRETLEFMAGSIRKFHQDQKPDEMWFHEIRPGVFAGDRTTAIPSVACYIPRGKGAFPSSVLMQSIPATVAGVR